MLQGPVINSVMKASLRMSGIALVLLVTFLCLVVPSIIHSRAGHTATPGDHDQYLAVWKVSGIDVNKIFGHFPKKNELVSNSPSREIFADKHHKFRGEFK